MVKRDEINNRKIHRRRCKQTKHNRFIDVTVHATVNYSTKFILNTAIIDLLELNNRKGKNVDSGHFRSQTSKKTIDIFKIPNDKLTLSSSDYKIKSPLELATLLQIKLLQ